MLEIWGGRVNCPLCQGNGQIYETTIFELNRTVYACYECDALWENIEELAKGIRCCDFSSYLNNNNLNPHTANYTDPNLGYEWYINKDPKYFQPITTKELDAELTELKYRLLPYYLGQEKNLYNYLNKLKQMRQPFIADR